MGDIRKVSVRWVEGKEFETTTESGHRVTTDAREHAGGRNRGPSPMELLLASLGSCTGISVVDILRKKRQAVTGFEIRVEGLGADTYPKGYTDIEVVYVVRGRDIDPAAVEEAIHISKTKYCGISDMLSKAAAVRTRYEIVPEGAPPALPEL